MTSGSFILEGCGAVPGLYRYCCFFWLSCSPLRPEFFQCDVSLVPAAILVYIPLTTTTTHPNPITPHILLIVTSRLTRANDRPTPAIWWYLAALTSSEVKGLSAQESSHKSSVSRLLGRDFYCLLVCCSSVKNLLHCRGNFTVVVSTGQPVVNVNCVCGLSLWAAVSEWLAACWSKRT